MEQFIRKHYLWFFLLFLAVIVGLSFYLGYQEGSSSGLVTENKGIVFSCPNTVLSQQKIVFSNDNPEEKEIVDENASLTTIDSSVAQGMFVGSKNGTKYYTPGCSGVNRIKPENYTWFQSVEDATLQGYSKGSC